MRLTLKPELEVIKTDTDRSAAYDFLLTLTINHDRLMVAS